MFKKRHLGGAAVTALMLATPAAVYAQTTTGSMRAYVADANGAPINDAQVVLVHEPTGSTYVGQTTSGGFVTESGLRVGGPYNVTVSAEGYQTQRVDGLNVDLGQTLDLNLTLAQGAASDEIIVTASRSVVAAVGPSSVFDQEALRTQPAINRNIVDVLRADPRIYVDESRGDINSVQCAGANPRFNSLTLDGVRLNDSFGLNSNGYPTERQPFPYDAVEQVSVELAPFDVEYGFFTACNINAVTKTGGNEFHGTLFYDYTDDSMRGDSLEGDPIRSGAYEETRYGIQVSGPIIRDRLFFSVAYEYLEGANLFDRGAIGSGAVNEVNVTQAELNRIADIARDVYQYDPGEIPSSAPNEDEKFLARLDWNVTNDHRASLTYIYNDGFNIVEADSDLTELEFSNHLYERGAELNSYVGQVFSDWTENFSTEVRVSYTELANRQISVNGTDFGEIQVTTPGGVVVYLGADDSRHSNVLSYDNLSLALKGTYRADDHTFTFGYEREAIDVFNLFVQHTETEIRFRSIDDFENGLASRLEYNNAPSNNPNDAAADWGYALNTVYAQDTITLNDALTAVLGVRYDWYTTDDKPAENADFLADYGYSNAQTIDGEGLIQPRLAITWDPTNTLRLRAGIGRYSGGNPNVWLSNNYSANNVIQFGTRLSDIDLFDDADTGGYTAGEEGVPNGPGWAIPVNAFNDVALGPDGQARNFEINALDPNFEIPSEWKLALGAEWYPTRDFPSFLGGDYVFNADFIYRVTQDSAIVIRGDLDPTGEVNAAGYPLYESNRTSSFILTNSDEDAHSWTASFAISRAWDNGFDLSIGYAYNDAEDINPMTSSVAFSNYNNRAYFDPQEQVASTSDYNIRHRFTAVANYEVALFGDYATRVSLYGQANSGPPYSLVQPDGFADNPYTGFPFFGDDGNLLITPGTRNDEEGDWWIKADLKLEQELPGLMGTHRTTGYIVIDNLTNLLFDEWGILREPGFPPNLGPGETLGRVGDASRYEIRVGVRYDF